MSVKMKPARDIEVGDILLTSYGDVFGVVTDRDTTTTPGVVYLYLDGHEGPPADVMANHADRLCYR